MWRTPVGTRVVRGIEAAIVRRGLETAHELIELGIAADDPWEFGVPQFDALLPEQQLALLADVGRALFIRSVRAPTHTAVNEGCVYAIFQALALSVQFEIDGAEFHEKSTRQLVFDFIAADRARGGDEAREDEGEASEDERELTPESCEIEAWEFEIDCMADRILWDRDWELDDILVDSSPEKAGLLKAHLGIDDEYFTAIAPDPTDLEQVRRTLRKLVREKPR